MPVETVKVTNDVKKAGGNGEGKGGKPRSTGASCGPSRDLAARLADCEVRAAALGFFTAQHLIGAARLAMDPAEMAEEGVAEAESDVSGRTKGQEQPVTTGQRGDGP